MSGVHHVLALHLRRKQLHEGLHRVVEPLRSRRLCLDALRRHAERVGFLSCHPLADREADDTVFALGRGRQRIACTLAELASEEIGYLAGALALSDKDGGRSELKLAAPRRDALRLRDDVELLQLCAQAYRDERQAQRREDMRQSIHIIIFYKCL